MKPRLKTELLVQAGIRYCESILVTAMLRRRGDSEAGAIFVKVSRLDGTSGLFTRVTSFMEDSKWQCCSGEKWLLDDQVEERLIKEIDIDPDIWIIEIENPSGENPFEEIS